MPVSASPSADGSTLTIKVSDRFDFNLHTQLRGAYSGAGAPFQQYVIDLRDTTYMDSSALGMLLQLREFAGGGARAVHIKNAKPAIREILAVANFQQLMTID